MFRKWRRALSLTLVMCILAGFSGCRESEEATVEEPKDDVKVSDSYFGLAYYPNGEFNPVTDNAEINRLLYEAMYEGLFEVSSNFTAQNVLCSEYKGDGTEFTFTLKEGVTFWSGSRLTAEDVVGSYQAAKSEKTSPYYSRLAEVDTIEAVTDLQVRITLSSPNVNFPKLLDIPVYRNSGEEDESIVEGTGPYKPKQEGSAWNLEANDNWHGGFLGAIRDIKLVTLPHPDAGSAFQTGEVSMISKPRIAPEGSGSRIGGSGTSVPVSSSSLHYLGFNHENEALANPKVRQALSAAISRSSICEVQLQTFADPAVLPVNPQPELEGLTLNMETSAAEAQELLKSAKLENDLEIRLLVNENNSFKCAAAEQIVGAWNALGGVKATLDKESYKYFKEALESRSFDVYYGETQLTPDFDLRPLMSPEGKLNYGKYSSEQTSKAITDARKGENVSALYKRLLSEMPIVPIAFEKGQIIIRKGVIEGFSPAPYNAFAGQEDWVIAGQEFPD